MPHDKHGNLIEVGDVVKAKVYERGQQVDKLGVVSRVIPGSTTCNLEAAHAIETVQPTIYTHTASDVEVVAKKDESLIKGSPSA
jgi:hypothetical protein